MKTAAAIPSKTVAVFTAVVTGGTPSTTNKSYWDGDVPWLNSGALNTGDVSEPSRYITKEGLRNSAAKLMPAETVLVALTGATTGQVGYLTFEACANQSVTGILPSPEHHGRYLYHFLRTQRQRIREDAFGAAQPHINQQYVKDLEVPLPSLPEQKRIAAILDAADALRVKRRESIKQLDSLIQATFLEMFGDPVTNPKGWEVLELNSLIRSGDKINYGVVQPGDDVVGGKPLIRVGDFVGGELDTSRIKCIAPDIEAKYRRSRLNGSELLISCVTAGVIGTVCKASNEVRGFNIARAVARVPLSEDVDRAFMLYCLRTETVRRHFVKETRAVAQPTLNIGDIKTAPVFLPPRPLQTRFATIVEAIEQQKARMKAHLAELDNLFASLQSRAFNGELVA
jgi:type I restriction enzyme S subunit